MQPIAPRHFMPSVALPGAGLPNDRLARLAARRSFVTLKQGFMGALADLACDEGDWLRHQVRAAEEPGDLWLLRAPVFEALGNSDKRQHRQALRRCLDSMFPDSEMNTGFGPF